jgi:hypothetical protein
MNTTLKAIKKHVPCTDGWHNLLKHLGKTEADNEPLSILTILESNGIDDALWALRAVEGKDREIRLMAADFAESVLHIFEAKYPTDDRPRKAIQATRDYTNGLITLEQLNAAGAAVRDAARVAARDAVGGAVGAAAWFAVMDAAWVAARDAADAAWAAERLKQIEILKRYCELENVEA